MVVSVSEAAAHGDRLAALMAIRDRLAREIDECGSPRALAELTGKMIVVLQQIDDLKPKQQADVVDEIAQRRLARRPGAAAGKVRPARTG